MEVKEFGHHLMQTFAPSTIVVILSWFSFWFLLDAIAGIVGLLPVDISYYVYWIANNLCIYETHHNFVFVLQTLKRFFVENM